MSGYDGDAISESELCGDEERDADIAMTQAEWDEIHDCPCCSECELKTGCQTEPNFGCQVEEKKRRALEAKSIVTGVQQPVISPVCEKCGRRLDDSDVRMVRFRVAGRATDYHQTAVPLCFACRAKNRGRWMYADRAW